MFGNTKKDQNNNGNPKTIEPNKNSSLEILKPKILLIDCHANLEKSLKAKGHNISTGSFGTPYRTQMGDGYFPVISNHNLPNCEEQEIVVVDLLPNDLVDAPIGTNNRLPNEPDWWVKASNDFIDPRPKSMTDFLPVFDRILFHGGIFIIFSDSIPKQDFVIGKNSARSSLSIQGKIEKTTWSFLTPLEDLYVYSDNGEEIRVIENENPLAKILKDVSKESSFNCVLDPKPWKKDSWKTIANNKYGTPISLIYYTENKKGNIFIFPQIKNKEKILLYLLEDFLPGAYPELFPNSTKGSWIHNEKYEIPKIIELNLKKKEIQRSFLTQMTELDAKISTERENSGWLQHLLTTYDKNLVDAVKKSLEILGFQKIIDVDVERDAKGVSRREDLQILDGNPSLIIDIKGIGGLPSDPEIQQAEKHATIRIREWDRTDVNPLTIINHQRYLPPLERENAMPFREDMVENSKLSRHGLLTTFDLFRLVKSFLKNQWKPENVKPIFYNHGRIEIIPAHYKYLGKINNVWKEAFSVQIEKDNIKTGDKIGFETDIDFEEATILSLQLESQPVQEAISGSEIGIKANFEKIKLKKGMKIYRIDTTN